MRFLFVTNFCPHYRVRTFELLARQADVRFVFFSTGGEWYWGQRHGRQHGDFPHEYLQGFSLSQWMRVTPRLIPILWRYDGNVILKCITGRFALPVSLAIAKLRRKPFVLWTGMWRHPRTLFHLLTYPVTRFVYAMSDAIVVYGEHVKRYLTSLGVTPEKIFVAAHAVDNAVYARAVPDKEREELRQRFDLGERQVLLYVGRLEPSKGLDTLLTAYKQVAASDNVLVLVGDGSLRDQLRESVRRLALENQVVLVGYVSPTDTVAFYALATVLVLPSVTVRAGAEPWGLVVNEAMNQGTPVIASTAVGAAMGGLVQPGRTGEIVPERDPAALATAMRRVLTDSEYRARLRREALLVIGEWGNERMVGGFLEAVRYAAAGGRA